MTTNVNTVKSTRPFRFAAALALALGAGCAHQVAAPVIPPASVTGPPVSSYAIPNDEPRGMVHVVSLGNEPLAVTPQRHVPYLHLRIAAVNSSDARVWTLDSNRQRLRVGDQVIEPAFAEASSGGDPVLTLARGARGYLDLYYPQPPSNARVGFEWRLGRGDGELTHVTALEPVVDRDSAYVYFRAADDAHLATGHGMGSWWWGDYYFWSHDRCWWSYRRTHFHRHYPDRHDYLAAGGWHGAGPAPGAPGATAPAAPARSPSGISALWRSWRGASESAPAAETGKSSWRGSPSRSSSSSSSSPLSSSSSSSSSSPSSSSSSSSSPSSSSSSPSSASSGGSFSGSWGGASAPASEGSPSGSGRGTSGWRGGK